MTGGQREVTIFLFNLPRPVQKKLIIQSQGFSPQSGLLEVGKKGEIRYSPILVSILFTMSNDS